MVLLPLIPAFTSYESVHGWVDGLMEQYRKDISCPKCGQRGVLYKNWSKFIGPVSNSRRHRRYDHKHCLELRSFSMSCADFVEYVLGPYLDGARRSHSAVQRDTAATLLEGCTHALDALAQHGDRINANFHLRTGHVQCNLAHLRAALQNGLLGPDDAEDREDEQWLSESDLELPVCESEQSAPAVTQSSSDRSCQLEAIAALRPPKEALEFCIAVPPIPAQPSIVRTAALPVLRAKTKSLRPQKRRNYGEGGTRSSRRHCRARKPAHAAKKLGATSKRSKARQIIPTPHRFFSNLHGRPGQPKPPRGRIIIRAAREPPPYEPPLNLSAEAQLEQLRDALLRPHSDPAAPSLTISYLNVNGLNADKWRTVLKAYQLTIYTGHSQLVSRNHVLVLAETWRPQALSQQVLARDAAWILASTVPASRTGDFQSGCSAGAKGGLILLCPPHLADRVVVLSITPYSLTFSVAPSDANAGRPIVVHSVYLPPSMGRFCDISLLEAFASPPDSLQADVLLGDTNVYYEPRAPLMDGQQDPEVVERETAVIVSGHPKSRLAIIEAVTRALGLQRMVSSAEEKSMRFKRLNRKGMRMRRERLGQEIVIGDRPHGDHGPSPNLHDGATYPDREQQNDEQQEAVPTRPSLGKAISATPRLDHAYLRVPGGEIDAPTPWSEASLTFWRAGIKTDHPLMQVELQLRTGGSSIS